MFYERYLQLCREANIAPSAAATKAGFNRGTVSVWKKKYEVGQDVSPDREIINKICAFFGCAESWIRGISEPKEKAADPKAGGDDESMEDIIPGYDSLTKANKDRLRDYAALLLAAQQNQ